MISLSPKAVRFIDIAVRRLDDEAVKAIWASRDHDLGGALTDPVARAALTALAQFERHLRAQLETTTDEDEVSDLSNDLGLVSSIEIDLMKQLGNRAAYGT
jgi:hypothetical protein